MRLAVKITVILTALGLSACSTISREPVKSIDIYVKPYYSAEKGKAQNVFVHKQLDPLLRENSLKGYQSAVKFVEENSARISPITMFTLSARAYDFGLRDEAVKWFYRGQNRLITALYVLDLPKASIAEHTGFGQVVGQFINPYAFCDLNKQRQLAEEAINWVMAHPYEIVLMKALPSKFQDRSIALKEAETKLKDRLKEQDKFFADPQNKEKWQKERLENYVNERFCW
ncbi:hypothetical protein [Rodentibacter trehalosifermentans]|uniref:Lipoprotein n=1 Tax=Rodentibacter trehalosifermentans TaxID=1908263 RepID=A0A1V3IVS0_9PAST|nr:hypothetical protein [Rodentibacter trehalosifermentans]OOF46382.1 hypothetical protein BKK51_02540 [Rodentibacter trehalosifermentans]OOF47122.1 hypothetical protein BKK52_10050 [Rodentibacter trehalosifermentans]OOF53676.1 hypothetical protein BKK53_00735 [Rodentibacter trehalosifermentans]